MKVRLQEEEDLGGDDDPSKVGHVSKSLKSLSSAVLNLLYYVLCSNDQNWILHPLIKIQTFNVCQQYIFPTLNVRFTLGQKM